MSPTSVIADYIASHDLFAADKFFLLDIGCSGGINPIFRDFGDENLVALGIDPMTNEIESLRNIEEFSHISYQNIFVGLPENSDYSLRRGSNPWGNNPWGRLSVYAALQILENSKLTNRQKNEWSKEELASLADKKSLDQIVEESGRVPNFIKIDVDGGDLEVLFSGLSTLKDTKLLGVQIEVNFFGTDDHEDNTFHNIDRLLRSFGFELFDLTTRRYSNAAFPGKFLLNVPAQSLSGRILQGDALYFRDIDTLNDFESHNVNGYIKLAALFELHSLSDCAAEILLKLRNRSNANIDIGALLDSLAHKTNSKFQTYKDFISNFNRNPIGEDFIVK